MSLVADESPLALTEERFARFANVEWWQQQRLRDARVLVAGAGALGNEVVKNLALLGVGNVVIADMDTIELSNLTRSCLFREKDAGSFKAACAARAARELYPQMNVQALNVNITAALGLGWIRWAEIVIGALDNREARVFLNASCARIGRPWIDGGIEVLQGVARGFHTPETACYECTMSEIDWQVINTRRSCSMLARRALAHGGVPTTPLTASIVGAIQAQEVVKYLHGLPALFGRGFVYEGAHHGSYVVSYPIDPGCPWHEGAPPIEQIREWDSDTPLAVIWQRAEELLGGCDAIDLGREVVEVLQCVACGRRRPILQSVETVSEDDARCDVCGADSAPEFLHSIARGSTHLDRTPRELGLPAWDIVWARYGDRFLGLELAADAPAAMGGQ